MPAVTIMSSEQYEEALERIDELFGHIENSDEEREMMDLLLASAVWESKQSLLDEGMAIAASDLLAGVVSARPAGFVCFYAPAVDDAGARKGRPTAAFAIDHQQCMMQRLEHAAIPPSRKPAIGRALGRKVARHDPPGNAVSHDVENRVDDLTQRLGERPARPLRRR